MRTDSSAESASREPWCSMITQELFNNPRDPIQRFQFGSSELLESGLEMGRREAKGTS